MWTQQDRSRTPSTLIWSIGLRVDADDKANNSVDLELSTQIPRNCHGSDIHFDLMTSYKASYLGEKQVNTGVCHSKATIGSVDIS